MEEGQAGQVEQVKQERRRKAPSGKRRKGGKKKTTTKPKSYFSTFLSYFPNKHPGRFDSLSEESHEIESLYDKLYQGGKVVAQLPLSKMLVAELGVRAGIPQREGFVHFSATATDHQDIFFKAHIFGPTKIITTTAKVSLLDVITLSGTTKVGGNNEDLDFIDKAAARIHGPSFEIEATYNNSLKDQNQQEFGLSYTQSLTNNFFTGAAFIYSLKQRVSMISLASRYDNRLMALFGTIVLPHLPGTKLFVPNRITAGTAIALDDKQKVAVEFQLNPSETQIFDSLTTLFFTSNSKFSRFSISFDTMLRLGLLYQEIPTFETIRYLGAGQFSAYVDYKNAEYKIGLGTTIEI